MFAVAGAVMRLRRQLGVVLRFHRGGVVVLGAGVGGGGTSASGRCTGHIFAAAPDGA